MRKQGHKHQERVREEKAARSLRKDLAKFMRVHGRDLSIYVPFIWRTYKWRGPKDFDLNLGRVRKIR